MASSSTSDAAKKDDSPKKEAVPKADELTPSNNAWASLLGLISIPEYFVTVDHSVLWYRHVAWAKPKGEDLRTYVTQRFSSNMVVLSLMLGAQINVFFNSSVELTEMRQLMASETYVDLKFWIGFVIALDAFVTIMALVATFTLWGMVSAISDTNAHALLRSSIGQYVIGMPPRFVVLALYLFIFWLLLAFLDLMSGPSRIILATIVCFLFFQVVVPLSAFGRLVIHTGAMSSRRVLEEEFEKELLPSGLHASLLIRATGQRKKYTNAIHQYQKKGKKIVTSLVPPLSLLRNANSPSSRGMDFQTFSGTHSTASERFDSTASRSQTNAAKVADVNADMKERLDQLPGRVTQSDRFYSSTKDKSVNTLEDLRATQSERTAPMHPESGDIVSTPTHVDRHTRSDSCILYFPRASFLNSVGDSSDLSEVVNRALSEREEPDKEQEVSPTRTASTEDSPMLSDPKIVSRGATIARESLMEDEAVSSKPRPAELENQPSFRRRPSGRNSDSLINEWAEENTVRFLYDESPASMFVVPEDESVGIKGITESARLRPSRLNRDWGLKSLRDLLNEESLETPESSVGDEDQLLTDQGSLWDRNSVLARDQQQIFYDTPTRLKSGESADLVQHDVEYGSIDEEKQSLLHGHSRKKHQNNYSGRA